MTSSANPAAPALHIRRSTVDDAPGFVRLMGDPEVFGNLLGLPYPDVEFWRQRLSDSAAAGRADLSLVGVRDGHVVATGGLFTTRPALRQRHVMSLGIGVAREAHRQGVGSAMMRALIDYADNWGQVLRLELTVSHDNEAAIALYKKFGFEIEGRHRCDTLRAGRYVDSFTMARLHPSPPRLDVNP